MSAKKIHSLVDVITNRKVSMSTSYETKRFYRLALDCILYFARMILQTAYRTPKT